MRRLAALATIGLLAMSLATKVAACSIAPGSQPNPFEHRGKTPFADEVGRAASIEWVVAEAPMQRVCRRATDIGPRERDFWRRVHGVAAWFNLGGVFSGLLTRLPGAVETGTCGDHPVRGLISPMRARVVERIKGTGPKTFPIWTRYEVKDREWTGIGDARVLPETKSPWDRDYLALARARHRGPAFLDHGTMSGLWASHSSCGPSDQVLEPGRRYLLLRDSGGAMLLAEPVIHADDELLVRLRRAARQPALFRRVEWPVQDFVKASRAAAVYRIAACSKDDWGLHAITVLKRGDPKAAEMWGAGPDLWLADQLAVMGQQCRAGDQVLILASPFDGAVGSPYPRAALIRDGRIRTKELLTGLILTGPPDIAVDQAFAWVEEGAAARAEGR